MDVIAIRKHNLTRLVDEILATGKNKKTTAIALDMSASFLSQLLGGKKMGDDVARKIENARGLPRGWMDVLQPAANRVNEPVRAYEIRGVDGDDGVDLAREVMVPEVDVELGAGDGVPALEFVQTRYRLAFQLEYSVVASRAYSASWAATGAIKKPPRSVMPGGGEDESAKGKRRFTRENLMRYFARRNNRGRLFRFDAMEHGI